MSYTQSNITIEKLFDDNFVQSHPTVVVSVAGRDVARPASGIDWVNLEIISNPHSEQVTFGANPTFRRYGILQFSIHTDSQKGTKPNAELADDLSAVFTSNDFAVVSEATSVMRFDVSAYKSLGVRDGKFAGVLSIPYHVDSQD